jgi:calmodulin
VSQFSDEQISDLKELFSMCDEDGDGNVSKSQLWNVMQKLQLSISKEQFATFWNDLDKQRDGMLTFDEFLIGMKWLNKV